MRTRKESFILTLIVSFVLVAIPARAQERVYVLQGENGADCAESVLDCADAEACELSGSLSVEGDLIVDGDMEVTGAGSFDDLEVEDLVIGRSISPSPDCPRGYELDETAEDIIVCYRQSGEGFRDEMVKVGDIWVDRYESAIFANPDCSGTQYGGDEIFNWGEIAAAYPRHGGFSSPLYSCSVRGITPTRFMTSFQAQAACVASGKRLITDAEWQAAAAGTADPGSSAAASGPCLTDAGDTRMTGNAGDVPGGEDSCISYWGVEDMIGNMWEITADWWGQGADDVEGSQSASWFGDGYWNIDASEVQGRIGDDWTTLPAVNYRSGNTSWTREFDGVWVVVLRYTSSHENGGCSFRCVRGW